MNDLTDSERVVLSMITDAVLTRGYPPTIREIAEELGCAPATALARLRALQSKGRIERDPTRPRAIRILHA